MSDAEQVREAILASVQSNRAMWTDAAGVCLTGPQRLLARKSPELYTKLSVPQITLKFESGWSNGRFVSGAAIHLWDITASIPKVLASFEPRLKPGSKKVFCIPDFSDSDDFVWGASFALGKDGPVEFYSLKTGKSSGDPRSTEAQLRKAGQQFDFWRRPVEDAIVASNNPAHNALFRTIQRDSYVSADMLFLSRVRRQILPDFWSSQPFFKAKFEKLSHFDSALLSLQNTRMTCPSSTEGTHDLSRLVARDLAAAYWVVPPQDFTFVEDQATYRREMDAFSRTEYALTLPCPIMAVQLGEVHDCNEILMLWDLSERHEKVQPGDLALSAAFPEIRNLNYGIFALKISQHPIQKTWRVSPTGTHFELARFSVSQTTHAAIGVFGEDYDHRYSWSDELDDCLALEFIMHMNVLRVDFEAEHIDLPVCTVFDESGQICATHSPDSFGSRVHRMIPTDDIQANGLRALTRVEREKNKAETSDCIRRTIHHNFFGKNTAHRIRFGFNKNHPVQKSVTAYDSDMTMNLNFYPGRPPEGVICDFR